MNSRSIFMQFIAIAMLCQQLAGQPVWQVQNSPITEDLISVSFADTSHGWAISPNGSIIHTADGGKNWETETSPGGFYPNKIFFQNRDTGWMAGSCTTYLDTAFILKTVDGGKSWQRNFSRLAAKINDIFFVDEKVGFAVGFEGDTLGFRLKTIDGGLHWQGMVGINIISEFYSVHFRDSTTGVLCGSGPTLQHTTNGGLTAPGWAQIIYNFEVEMFDIVNLGTLYGCMVGAGGKIWFTKDEWNNFLDYDYSGGDTLRAVDALEPLSFYVVGDAGTILLVGYNQFLGLTALDQSLDIPANLLDIDAVDDAHIWAVGENGTILFFGFGPDGPSNTGYDFFAGDLVYPNPARDYIHIRKDPSMDKVIRLYTLQGTLIRSFLPGGRERRYDISNLAPGIYLLDTGQKIHKLVIRE